MATTEDILIDNLKETFKAIEKVLLLGLTAGLVLLVLAITNRELIGVEKLMFFETNAPAVLVAFVALGSYFAAGAMAVFYFASRRKIVKRVAQLDPGLVEAALLYPSVASKVGVPQIIALALVGAIGMLAMYLFYAPTHELKKVLLTSLVIGSPYILLAGMAFLTAVEEHVNEQDNKKEQNGDNNAQQFGAQDSEQ